ncbi:MAG: hypothetical protein ABS70_00520 [Nitrospira sp. SCN 59-13]|nr:MAG: hypothetical protein ABS70_00520 [Nitrospira sp. SCN 59-13]
MAITFKYQNDRQKLDFKVSDDGKVSGGITVTAYAESDVPVGAHAILADPQMPQFFSPYRVVTPYYIDENPFLKLGAMSIIPHVDNRRIWILTLDYKSLPPYLQVGPPWTHYPIASWDGVKFEVLTDVDMSGDAIMTSSFQFYNPKLKADRTRSVLTIRRNVQFYDHTRYVEARDSVNANPIFGYPAKAVKVGKVSADQVQDAFWGTYWVESIVLEFDIRLWTAKPVNASIFGVDPETGEIQRILDSKGQPVDEPCALDENGVRIPLGGVPLTGKWYSEGEGYDMYPLLDFKQFFNFQTLNIGMGIGVGV